MKGKDSNNSVLWLIVQNWSFIAFINLELGIFSSAVSYICVLYVRMCTHVSLKNQNSVGRKEPAAGCPVTGKHLTLFN